MPNFSTEYLKTAAGMLKVMYFGAYNLPTKMGPQVLAPFFIDSLVKKYTGDKMKNKTSSQIRKEMGGMVLKRIVQGPTVNVCLLGIPFLVRCYQVTKKRLAQQPQPNRPPQNRVRMGRFGPGIQLGNNQPNQQDLPPVELEMIDGSEVGTNVQQNVDKSELFKQNRNIGFKNLKALNSAPYTDVLLPVYQGLIACGLPEPKAREIAQGQWDQSEWVDHLDSDQELESVLNFLTKYTKRI